MKAINASIDLSQRLAEAICADPRWASCADEAEGLEIAKTHLPGLIQAESSPVLPWHKSGAGSVKALVRHLLAQKAMLLALTGGNIAPLKDRMDGLALCEDLLRFCLAEGWMTEQAVDLALPLLARLERDERDMIHTHVSMAVERLTPSSGASVLPSSSPKTTKTAQVVKQGASA